MRSTWARCVIAAAFFGTLVAGTPPAYAQYEYGDWYREYYPQTVTGWRGNRGYIWNYDWVLSAGGSHVSSIYIHDKPINFFEGDGYFDGQGVNWRHLETGLVKDSGDEYSYIFWQSNDYADGMYAMRGYPDYCSGTGYYGPFEIENYTMGNYAPEGWTIRFNGVPYFGDSTFGLLAGEALISAERWNGGDDNRALFAELKRKNSQGNWRYWEAAEAALDSDPGYHFSKYTDSHIIHVEY